MKPILAAILAVFIVSCASTQQKQEKQILLAVEKRQAVIRSGMQIQWVDSMLTVLDDKLDKMYIHERLMELRQYEAIKTDGKLKFKGIVTSTELTEKKAL